MFFPLVECVSGTSIQVCVSVYVCKVKASQLPSAALGLILLFDLFCEIQREKAVHLWCVDELLSEACFSLIELRW